MKCLSMKILTGMILVYLGACSGTPPQKITKANQDTQIQNGLIKSTLENAALSVAGIQQVEEQISHQTNQ